MLKLSDKIVNSLFKSKFLNFIPKRVIKRLIKKNKIFFTQTSLKSLPSNNYPFLLSLEDLDKKKAFIQVIILEYQQMNFHT